MKWNVALIRRVSLGIAGVAALVLIVLAVSGWFGSRIAPDAERRPWVPPAPFQNPAVLAVEQVEDHVIERFPGTVRAIREAIVSSRIVSEVREVLRRPGDHVKTGDPLIVLDSRDLEARVEQAREAATAAAARLDEAESYFNRMKEALERNAVARNAYDTAEAGSRAARAARESARQRLEEAQVNLSYARIEAPFDAIVIDRFVEPGDVASPGVPLLQLYDSSRMRLETYVRESMAIHLKGGRSVDVSLATLAAQVQGKVAEIVPQAEAGSRSFLVKVELPQMENLYPGMFGRLVLDAGPRKRIVVSRRALLRIGQLSYVVLADGNHTRRIVVPGEPAGDGKVEILSGLEAGEKILAPSGDNG